MYWVTQLWDAKAQRDQVQWLHYLEKLIDPAFDIHGRIGAAFEKWVRLCALYDGKAAE